MLTLLILRHAKPGSRQTGCGAHRALSLGDRFAARLRHYLLSAAGTLDRGYRSRVRRLAMPHPSDGHLLRHGGGRRARKSSGPAGRHEDLAHLGSRTNLVSAREFPHRRRLHAFPGGRAGVRRVSCPTLERRPAFPRPVGMADYAEPAAKNGVWRIAGPASFRLLKSGSRKGFPAQNAILNSSPRNESRLSR